MTHTPKNRVSIGHKKPVSSRINTGVNKVDPRSESKSSTKSKEDPKKKRMEEAKAKREELERKKKE